MRRHPGLHVGSMTALDWRGTRHNLSFRQTVSLWGRQQVPLPGWLTNLYPCTFQATQIFDETLDPHTGLQSLPNGHKEVMVSVPERALLEFMSDIGRSVTLDEARSLIESLHGLRLPVLEKLLAHTKRIKVVRLARMLAEEADMPWAELAARASENKRGGTRWIGVARSGERLSLKR